MATDAQIDANRRNAARSTGPKTEQGKAKARLNALKHGRRARTTDVVTVLPHEDPRQLEERIQVWIDDWQPRNALERELVRRAARLSWLLERGERFETAHLAHRVRLAGRKAGPTTSARRMKRVSDLGRRLFYDYRPGKLSSPSPPWDDEPAVFVAGLEETVEGCRWLLDRWGEIRTLLERRAAWSPSDVYRFIRLLGKNGFEAVHDPALNASFLAFEVFNPGAAETLWKVCRERVPDRDLAFHEVTFWRELAPRPADEPAARAVLRAVVDARIERLEQIVAEFQEIAEAEDAERADQAAFDPSPSFERHRRHQAALGRELLRTIDSLRRLRKESSIAHDSPGPAHGQTSRPCHPDTPPTQAPSEVDALSKDREVHEHENVTIEASPQSTQELAIMKVTSTCDNGDEDDRTQTAVVADGDSGAGAPGNPSWDKIPILSRSHECTPEIDRNGILSHEQDP